MLTRYLSKFSHFTLLRSPFATGVTRDRVDYYSILEVQSGATKQAIKKAYAELTQGLKPEFDSAKFKRLNQAFVILTDDKTRDAYDSLLSVRKTYYLSPQEETAPAVRSYLSKRRAQSQQELKKKMNIDEFGRYKGGLPNITGNRRGRSKNVPGTMHQAVQVEEELDRYPEFNVITQEKAESFKNFHQDEREARTLKWPWFSSQVDYDFFTLRNFRKKVWPKLQLIVLLFYIIPSLYYTFKTLQKRQLQAQFKAKVQKKALAEAAKSSQSSSQSH